MGNLARESGSAGMRIHPGLVSVTFRDLSPREIVELAQEARLEGIEWGGDVHVPHGALACAREVRALTREAGLSTSAYGSYYRVSESEARGLRFEAVLETALELRAPTIRIWAGTVGSSKASPGYRKRIVEESRRIASLAAASGVSVSYEYHGGTLTDTGESARQLLEEVSHPNVHTFWQPPTGAEFDHCLRELRSVLPRLTNVHVFHWWPDPAHRRPLVEGRARWSRYLGTVASSGRAHFASIEFVKDDDPGLFLQDADTLRTLLAQAGLSPRPEIHCDEEEI